MTVRTRLLDRVRRLLADRADAAVRPRVTVAPRVVLVELEHPRHGRLAGVAHRPRSDRPSAESTAPVADASVGAASPHGASVDPPSGAEPDASRRTWPRSAAALSSLAVDAPASDPLARAVGIATLNALSAPDVHWRPGDPMAALSPDVGVVATVGLFRPAFRKFGDVEVRVVERDPDRVDDLPSGASASVYAPEECGSAFDGADVCFVTGSTLIYGGVDRYLAALTAVEVPLVVLIGSTASFLPEPAFDAGVDVLAGARVTDPDRVREHATAGDCDTDLHDNGLEKGFVSAREELPGLDVQASSDK
ncbi:MAG: Rossmann-like domain-containing protein [Salinigranum sp.]